jgi:hypothetical protein
MPAPSPILVTKLKELGSHADWYPVTPSNDPQPKAFRAIRATDDCNITVTTATGDADRVMEFKSGETRRVVGTHIKEVSAGTCEAGT